MPESQNTEWKSKWKDEYLEWICGYANAQGGKLYIGCDGDGQGDLRLDEKDDHGDGREHGHGGEFFDVHT